MKNLFIIAMAVSFISCEPEEFDTLPTPCTLKLSRDYNPLAGMQLTSFSYTDIDGIDRYINNPSGGQVDNVDFSQPVRITASAGNNFQPQVVCNWNLKKDGVVIEVQNVSYFVYQN